MASRSPPRSASAAPTRCTAATGARRPLSFSLHFETCYYQGIEYCIEHGLARFEPGTQGEHKISRGFRADGNLVGALAVASAVRRGRRRLPRPRTRATSTSTWTRPASTCPIVRPMTDLHWLSARRSSRQFPRPAVALTNPTACWPSAATCRPSGCSLPTAAGSSPGSTRTSRFCGGHPDPARRAAARRYCTCRAACAAGCAATTTAYRSTSAFDARDRRLCRPATDEGTWITPEMRLAYCRACTNSAFAHSIETWHGRDELVGGLYGVNIGRVFFGESMFSRRTDASKVALVALVALGSPHGPRTDRLPAGRRPTWLRWARLLPRERIPRAAGSDTAPSRPPRLAARTPAREPARWPEPQLGAACAPPADFRTMRRFPN